MGFELLVCPTELGGTVWIAPADPHCWRVEWPAVGVYCGERRVQHVEDAAFVAAVCAAGSFFEASEEDGEKGALLHLHGITSGSCLLVQTQSFLCVWCLTQVAGQVPRVPFLDQVAFRSPIT